MNKITQTARYRQSLILYAKKHGVTKAAIRYHTNRQLIYHWMKRYDGTLRSLEDRSHRPNSHPNQHRPEEIKLIDDMRRRNPEAGLMVFQNQLTIWNRYYNYFLMRFFNGLSQTQVFFLSRTLSYIIDKPTRSWRKSLRTPLPSSTNPIII